MFFVSGAAFTSGATVFLSSVVFVSGAAFVPVQFCLNCCFCSTFALFWYCFAPEYFVKEPYFPPHVQVMIL